MDERDYSLGELDRRMGNLVRIGTVSAVDPATGLVKVDLGDLVTDWVPWTTPRAGQDRVWSTPDIGEQVVLASPGDPSQGVVLGSLFQDAHPQNGSAGKDRRITFKDGTVLEFDRDGSVMNVTLNPAGNMNLTVGGSKFEMNTSRLKLTSNGSTLELDAAGIRLNGARIDLN